MQHIATAAMAIALMVNAFVIAWWLIVSEHPLVILNLLVLLFVVWSWHRAIVATKVIEAKRAAFEEFQGFVDAVNAYIRTQQGGPHGQDPS